MPIYHFHLADHIFDEDKEGTELPDLAAARIQAVIFAADYLHDAPEMVWDGGRLAIHVTDDAGTELFRVEIAAHDT